MIITALPPSVADSCQATASSTSATPAAVASETSRDVSTPDIRTGKTSNAAKFKLPLDTSTCRAVKARRSTPMVEKSWRRRRAALSWDCGSDIAPKRGNSHIVMDCAA